MNSSLDKRKFALIVARLSSEHDGEVLAAARAATRMLATSGETWETALLGRPVNRRGYQVHSGPVVSEEAPSFAKPPLGMTVAKQMEYALARYETLPMNDKMLLTTFRAQLERGTTVALSPRNQRLLQDIVRSLMEREDAR